MTKQFQLAQINIAQGLATLEDPIMQGFVDQLERLNQLAEASPGFIWRLQDESGDATSINAFGDDRIIINISVWDSLESQCRMFGVPYQPVPDPDH